MIGARNISRLATAGFVLTCVVVLGGMAWATHATLRLERLERLKAEHAREDDRVWAHLGRMDHLVMTMLAPEWWRPYTHYFPYSSPANAIGNDGAVIEAPDRVWLPSPVLESPLPWVDLYFQVRPDGRWSSPQLPDDRYRWTGSAFMTESEYFKLEQTLLHLASRLPPDELGARIVALRAFSDTAELEAGGPDVVDQHMAVKSESRGRSGSSRRRGKPRNLREFQTRQREIMMAQMNSLPPQACDPKERVAYMIDPPEEACLSPSSEGVPVVVSVMTPFWVATPDGPEPKLAFVRTANIDGKNYYQGFMVDWKRFSSLLIKRFADLRLQAKLTPVYPQTEFDQHTRLFTIPASLTIQPTAGVARATARWSEPHRWPVSLLISWATAIGALAALGFGVQSLVALTHRRMQFAYAVAHELRTPLTTFRLYTDMLAAGLVPESSKQEYLDTLNRESKRLGDLVNGVLEYARLENRAVRRHPTTVDGAALIQRAEGDFGHACSEEGVTLVTDNALPPDLKIRTDVDLLMCVAGVLVANACRHSKTADSPQVLLRLEKVNGHVCLNVIDNGPGVSASDARHIHKPFHRGALNQSRERKRPVKHPSRRAGIDGSRAVPGPEPVSNPQHDPQAGDTTDTAVANGTRGLGLGLALAGKWTKLLGGRLELAARNDPVLGGAAFRVSLPCDATLPWG